MKNKTIFVTLLVFFALMALARPVYADSAGPNSPGTMADDSSRGGGVVDSWHNVDSAKASDNTYTTAYGVMFGGGTHYLKATNFGFSIPGTATIKGIKVEVEAYDLDSNDESDSSVVIVKSNGAYGTTDKANGFYWGESDNNTYTSYGGATDLWGETWTPADINNANFGVGFAAYDSNPGGTSYVDHIRITVYYTAAAGGGMAVKSHLGPAHIGQGKF